MTFTSIWGRRFSLNGGYIFSITLSQGPLSLQGHPCLSRVVGEQEHEPDTQLQAVGNELSRQGEVFGQLPPHFKHKFSFVHLGEYQKCTNDCYL